MKVVPWWFQTVAHTLAVVFALWVGVHYRAPIEWIVLYGLVAATSAVLPVHRVCGFVGLGAALLVGGWGAYLLRDAVSQVSVDRLIDFHGGILGGGREVVALGIAAVWLLFASLFRTTRV